MKEEDYIIIKGSHYKHIIDRLDSLSTKMDQLNSPTRDQWYTEEEVKNILKVTSKTLRSYRNLGKLAFIKSARKIYYKCIDLEEFMNNNHFKAFK